MKATILSTILFLVSFNLYAELLNSNELNNLPGKILRRTNADKIFDVKISTNYTGTIGSALSIPIRMMAADPDFPVARHFYDLKFSAQKKKNVVVAECIAYDYQDDQIIIGSCRFRGNYRQYLIYDIFRTTDPTYIITYKDLND